MIYALLPEKFLKNVDKHLTVTHNVKEGDKTYLDSLLYSDLHPKLTGSVQDSSSNKVSFKSVQ